MKTAKKAFSRIAISFLILLAIASKLAAQQQFSITGTVVEFGASDPIPFANVALYSADGTMLISGASCGLNGDFMVKPIEIGAYQLTISAIGYESVTKEVDVSTEPDANLGSIYLEEKAIGLQSVTVIGERVRAKSEADKNTFFISNEMKKASSTGADIIKFIPGIQVDLMRNISIDGNRNILILVDGRERDAGFINQLNAQNIERIEISNTPPARFEGSISGVINIILAKDKGRGFDGHIFVEVPTSKTMVYIFPTYSLNYGVGKLNLFTSYNGEVSRLNQNETTQRYIFDQVTDNNVEIISKQFVLQNNWSHRFNYGLDYFINSKNQLNFYGYHNRFSQEYDGQVETVYNGNTNSLWQANKEDDDRNTNNFYSIFYKHSFDASTNHELAIDISLQHFDATSSTHYSTSYDNQEFKNLTYPQQQNASVRLDYSLPISSSFMIKLGAKGITRELKNGGNFQYNEQQLSGYAEGKYKGSKVDANLGFRYEESNTKLLNGLSAITHNLLPTLSVGYKHSNKHNTRIAYRKSIGYPNLYQLNPYTNFINPYSLRSGNATLSPTTLNTYVLEHSIRVKKGFVNTRLFYTKRENAMDNLLIVDEEGVFRSQPNNLGDIHEFGLRGSGTITLGKRLTINPVISFFRYSTKANRLAKENSIVNRQGVGFSSSLSSLVSLGKGFSLSGILQYYTPITSIQSSTFEDATYFIAIEKEFKGGLKVGAVSAIPFTKEFTYFGEKTIHKNFNSHTTGKIEKSLVPIWFRITYQFATGKRKSNIDRTLEDIETIPRTGF